MKRIFLTFPMIALLTGCSSHGNVNDKAYLRAAAIDGDRVTFSFYSEEDKVISVNVRNPEKAKSAAELAMGKEIFTGHTELVVAGDCDILEVLDNMLHEWKVSPSCRVAEAKTSGEELLNSRSAEELADVIDTAHEKGLAPKCDIITVLSGLLGENELAEVAEFSDNGFCGTAEIKR